MKCFLPVPFLLTARSVFVILNLWESRRGKVHLISFELTFGKEKLPLMGEVAWEKSDPVRGYTYGIRFVNLEERHREAIIRFVLLEEQRHRRLQDN